MSFSLSEYLTGWLTNQGNIDYDFFHDQKVCRCMLSTQRHTRSNKWSVYNVTGTFGANKKQLKWIMHTDIRSKNQQ
jgi:hypothetical protein